MSEEPKRAAPDRPDAATDAVDVAPELLATLAPDPASPLSNGRQLYLAAYRAIVGGRLVPGAALPPSRALAAALGIARNTVVATYAQLADEGLVEGAGRRGTRVLARPDAGSDRAAGRSARPAATGPARPPPLAARAAAARDAPAARPRGAAAPFECGEPDAALFPRATWRRALLAASRVPPSRLGYRPDGAAPAVREAIARHLATRRSLAVDPERIVVTSGTRQSLALAATLYADPGDVALVESPGWAGAAQAFAALGLDVRAAAVDARGLVVPEPDDPDGPDGPDGEAAPRLVHATPCFQYPTGVPLAPERREALLRLSVARGTVIVEDDYDSEFRGVGEPRPALAAEAEARGATVLHAGTFSKLLFPAARVAWLVVPAAHAEAAEACLRALGGGHGSVAQAAVAALLDGGDAARHLVRARAVYARRREVLDRALAHARHLAPATPGGTALAALASLCRPAPLGALERALIEAGLGARPLERFAPPGAGGGRAPRRCRTLVLGLGSVDALSIPARLAALDRLVGEL